MTKIACSPTGQPSQPMRILTAIMEAEDPVSVAQISRIVRMNPSDCQNLTRKLYLDGRIVRRRVGRIWHYFWRERFDQGEV